MSGEGQQSADTIRCEACGTAVPAYDIVHHGSIEQAYRALCTSCLNADMASALGLNLLMDKLERAPTIRRADADLIRRSGLGSAA
jgi:hypothetical protein